MCCHTFYFIHFKLDKVQSRLVKDLIFSPFFEQTEVGYHTGNSSLVLVCLSFCLSNTLCDKHDPFEHMY